MRISCPVAPGLRGDVDLPQWMQGCCAAGVAGGPAAQPGAGDQRGGGGAGGDPCGEHVQAPDRDDLACRSWRGRTRRLVSCARRPAAGRRRRRGRPGRPCRAAAGRGGPGLGAALAVDRLQSRRTRRRSKARRKAAQRGGAPATLPDDAWSARRRGAASMSSMLSAPGSHPGDQAGDLQASAFTPRPGRRSLTCSPTTGRQAGRARARAVTGIEPGPRHEIRVIKRCVRLRRIMRQTALARCPLEPGSRKLQQLPLSQLRGHLSRRHTRMRPYLHGGSSSGLGSVCRSAPSECLGVTADDRGSVRGRMAHRTRRGGPSSSNCIPGMWTLKITCGSASKIRSDKDALNRCGCCTLLLHAQLVEPSR